MKEIQKNASILVIIAAISVTFLSLIKECTKEDYRKTMLIEENKIRKSIFPNADKFQKIKIDKQEAYVALKNGSKIGLLVKGTGKGFGGDIVITLGIDLAGANKKKIRGVQLVKHNETPGLGTKANEAQFKNAFKNKNLQNLPDSKQDFKAKLGIDTIAGATITSLAMLNAVKDALRTAEKYYSNNDKSDAKEKSGSNTDTGSKATGKQNRQSMNINNFFSKRSRA